MKLIILSLLLVSCMNKVEVPSDVNLHSDPIVVTGSVNVSIELSGAINVALNSSQTLSGLVDSKCSGDKNCQAATQTQIQLEVNNILTTLGLVK